MKNIHLLPTDKPSRLRYNLSNILVLTKEAYRDYRKQVNQNIYITSDEKFVRDEYITDVIEAIKASPKLVDAQGLVTRRNWRKIILTTDQDLIEDGVQAIDDEFLEWFVKNPNCEWVEIREGFANGTSYGYKIIIPKEEPKQETLEEVDENKKNLYYQKQVMNPYPVEGYSYTAYEKGFIDGYYESTKWQQEQDKNKYSEEEVLEIIDSLFHQYASSFRIDAKEHFLQFKKK